MYIYRIITESWYSITPVSVVIAITPHGNRVRNGNRHSENINQNSSGRAALGELETTVKNNYRPMTNSSTTISSDIYTYVRTYVQHWIKFKRVSRAVARPGGDGTSRRDWFYSGHRDYYKRISFGYKTKLNFNSLTSIGLTPGLDHNSQWNDNDEKRLPDYVNVIVITTTMAVRVRGTVKRERFFGGKRVAKFSSI